MASAENTHVRYVVHGDFNRLRADSLLNVRTPFVVLKPGDQVIVEDGDGNRCNGVVERLIPQIRVDLKTWVDGPNG